MGGMPGVRPLQGFAVKLIYISLCKGGNLPPVYNQNRDYLIICDIGDTPAWHKIPPGIIFVFEPRCHFDARQFYDYSLLGF